MKIDIKIPNLLKQTMTNVIESFLEIEETHLRYYLEFWAEEWVNEDDESLGKREVFNLFDVIAFKKDISGIELSNTIEPPRYKIIIPVQGFGQDIKIYFKKREEAQALTDTIKRCLFN